MIYLALAAGGVGSRMGADIPKQFLTLCGRPIIMRTIEKFLAYEDEGPYTIDKIYIGVHKDHISTLAALCREAGERFAKVVPIEGGQDRNDTIFRIVSEIENVSGITDDDIIITHDAVRPFVSERMITESIRAMSGYDAVTAAVSAADTIAFSRNGEVIYETPDRAEMFHLQTPQTFRLRKLIGVCSQLTDGQKKKLTDTAGMFTAAGVPVGIIEGSRDNIKITTPEDMALAEILLRRFK